MLPCEDGGGIEDGFGPGERLLGLTPAGETFIFAKNNIALSGMLSRAGKSAEYVEATDHRDNQCVGATFDPTGRILFVNIQTPEPDHPRRQSSAVRQPRRPGRAEGAQHRGSGVD